MGRHFRIPGRLQARCARRESACLRCCKNARLPASLFDQDRILVTTSELFALWREIGRAGQPGIGLALGSETKAENFDPSPWPRALHATFGDAMRQVAATSSSPALKRSPTRSAGESGASSSAGF